MKKFEYCLFEYCLKNTSIYKLCIITNTFYKERYFTPALHINHLPHHNFFRTNFDIIHQSNPLHLIPPCSSQHFLDTFFEKLFMLFDV